MDGEAVVPVLKAAFVSSVTEPMEILIARGNIAKPVFERVVCGYFSLI